METLNQFPIYIVPNDIVEVSGTGGVKAGSRGLSEELAAPVVPLLYLAFPHR